MKISLWISTIMIMVLQVSAKEERSQFCSPFLPAPKDRFQIAGSPLSIGADKKTIFDQQGKVLMQLDQSCTSDYISGTKDGTKLLNLCDNTLISVKDRKVTTIGDGGASLMMPDGSMFRSVMVNDQIRVEKTNLESGKSELIEGETRLTSCGVVQNRGNQSFLIVGNRAMPMPPINFNKPIKISCSPNKEHFYFLSENREIFALKMDGNHHRIRGDLEKHMVDSVQVSDSGEVRISKRPFVRTFDQQGGLKSEVYLDLEKMHSFDVASPFGSAAYDISHVKVVCAKEFNLVKEDCDQNASEENKQSLKAIVNHAACEAPVNSELWKRTRQPAPQTMNEDLLVAYLRKMQRPGGFHPQNDVPLVYAAADFAKNNKKILGELKNVLATLAINDSNSFFLKHLIESAPHIGKTSVDPKEFPLCQSEAEKLNLKKWVPTLIEKFKADGKYSHERMIALAPLLADVPANEREQYIEDLAEARAAEVAKHGISGSTAYYSAKNLVGSYFGQPGKALLDTQYLRRKDGAQIVHFGNRPFQDETGQNAVEISSGLYSLSLKANTKVENTTEHKLILDGETFVSKVKIQPLDQAGSQFVDVSESPNYKALAKDKKLSGFIVIGANMLKDKMPADLVIHRYKKYFIDQGFKFADPVPVSNARERILNQIAKGEIDYFSKEAHGGGDVHSVVDIGPEGHVMEGGFKDPKTGRTEKVTLYLPSKSKKTESISRDDLANAFHERKAIKGDKPFFYFNNSCSGIIATPSDLAVVQDKAFISIAADSDTTDFHSSPWSPSRQILHGVRNEKSYTQISEMIRENPNWEASQKNRYILPNEPAYKELVVEGLAQPTKEKISIFKNGKPYRFAADVRNHD